MPRRSRRIILLAALLTGPIALDGRPTAARAQDEGPDPDDLRPGLVATFTSPARGDGHAPRVVRVAPSLVDRWGEGAPDPRLDPADFTGAWSGWLLIREAGPYCFRIDTDGPTTLQLGGRAVLASPGEAVRSDPIELRPGLISLRIDYDRGMGDARMVVDWDGPSFSPEQIPPNVLYHEAAVSPPDDAFEQGRRLADRLGCASCHGVLNLPSHPDLGPPLDASRGIRPDWLVDWLADPASTRPGTPMPGFGLDRQQAADLTAFLRRASVEAHEPDPESRMALNVADAGRGRLLFRSAGCLGCHPRPEADEPHSARYAPDLSGLGQKRPFEVVAAYLGGTSRRDPGRHRPELGLSAEAAAHLAAYLTLGSTPEGGAADDSAPLGDPGRGESLIATIGCVACHEIPGVERRPEVPPLAAGSDPASGCLADDPPSGIPHFSIDDGQRQVLRAFVAAIPEHPASLPPWTLAEDAIRRRNCLGCHSRYGEGGEGIGTQLATLLAEDRELNTLKGTLTPPDLSSVGAKLRPEYLDLAVRGQAPTARPWLSVRMPRYRFEPGEAEAITSYFREFDRVGHASQDDEAPPSIGKEVGIRLLGREGFGCVSCHVIGGRIPPGGEAETLGPDLALAHRRMTRGYYERWLSDPQRIIPGTPMPQFLIPAAGVGGTLDQQLGAVWDALGDEQLAELTSNATRQFLDRQGDRAMVVRDMVLPDDAPADYYPRGIAIGLRGDRSLLFDADRLSWVRWWDGGFLYRTKQGRLWEWHPEGRALWVTTDALPPVVFSEPGEAPRLPEEDRERFGSFGELTFEGDGVSLCYTLNGPGGAPVAVTERIEPTEGGWNRHVTIRGVPDDLVPLVVAATGANREPGGRSRWQAGLAVIEVPDDLSDRTVNRSIDATTGDVLLVPAGRGEDGGWSCTLRVVALPDEG